MAQIMKVSKRFQNLITLSQSIKQVMLTIHYLSIDKFHILLNSYFLTLTSLFKFEQIFNINTTRSTA